MPFGKTSMSPAHRSLFVAVLLGLAGCGGTGGGYVPPLGSGGTGGSSASGGSGGGAVTCTGDCTVCVGCYDTCMCATNGDLASCTQACNLPTGSGGSAGSGGSGGSGAVGGTGAGGSSGAAGSGAVAGSGGAAGSGGGVALDPPAGASSNGVGGPAGGGMMQAGGVSYQIVMLLAYQPSVPAPFLLVYSGVEGGAQMAQNLFSVGPTYGVDGFLCAVIDGSVYYGDGNAGAAVLDDVRARYNIDNDRTYLLGESAGTSAALTLGFHLRQSYFAAYWANDVNAVDSPGATAAQLGFQPWGQAGPGGHFPEAQQIVQGMQQAGYRVPTPAPYDGPGSQEHGASEQFHASLGFFTGKTRQ